MIPGTSWLDWKLGGRMLLKYPGLSVIGGLTLATAIGLGAGWFEVTRQLLQPRLPFPDGHSIVRIDNWDAAKSEVDAHALYDFQFWREQLESIRELGAYRSLERNLITRDGSAQPAAVAEISASAFPLTRVTPLLGRPLLETDEQPGSADVVVIGYDIWQSLFNGDPGVIGRMVRLGRLPATIVGVMPEGFHFPVNHQVWTPLRVANAAPREGPSISVFGRLAEGASLESAQAELTVIGQRIATMNAATHQHLRPFVARYGAPGPGDNHTVVFPGGLLVATRLDLLLRLSNIVAWLILAVVCVNVATLMFARTATRESEIVLRNALGASRARIMVQLLVEALVLSGVAALVGLMGASFALDYGIRFAGMEGEVPFWWQFDIRPVTVAYAAALAVGGAGLIGLLPALNATGPHLHAAITRMSAGDNTRSGGVWSVMIVLQVALAALCLPLGIAATYDALRDDAADSAFPLNEYLTFWPQLDRDDAVSASGGGEDAAAAYRTHLLNVYIELKGRLESEPSVAAVTFGNGMPRTFFPLRQVEAQRGSEPTFLVDADIESDYVRTATVDAGYFATFRMPLVGGREFHAGDVDAGTSVIINETLARNIGGSALGVRIRYRARPNQPESPWYEVVGIVRDAAIYGKPVDLVFLPVSAAAASPLQIAVRVRGDVTPFAPRLRAVAAQIDPALRLYDVQTLDERVRHGRLPEIRGMFGMLAIMLLIVALSAAGLYSLMSVAVTRRTREIGIRLAIGASPRKVLTAVVARAALQLVIGIVLANVLMPSLMSAIGISELKPGLVVAAMLIASVGMLLVGLVACGVPARRALRIQAIEAMRYTG
jgi:predicted permease